MMLPLLLASCGQIQYVDTACEFMPRGTMHREDTPTTKRWMISYEMARQEKCKHSFSE